MRKLLLWLVLCLIALALLSATVGIGTRPCRTYSPVKQAAGAALAQLDANGNELTSDTWYTADSVSGDEPCYEPTYYESTSEPQTYTYEEVSSAEPYDYTIDVYPDYYESGTTWYSPHTTLYTTPTYTPYTTYTQAYEPVTYTSGIGLTQTIVPIGVPTGGLTYTYTPEPSQPVTPVTPVRPILPPSPPAQPQAPEPDPTCFISTYPSVINSWESASLSWGSERASAAYLSDFGGVAVSGGAQVMPGASRAYTLTVTSPSGKSTSCQTSVIVRSSPAVYHPPSCYISVSPSQIRAGDSATVSWGSTDATSAFLNEAGQVGMVGSYQVAPRVGKAYVLSVVGPGGASTCSSILLVTESQTSEPAPQPQTPAAPACNLSADAASIFQGGSAKLTWSTQHATGVTLSGIGTVTAAGTRSVSPVSTQKYILTATGAGGMHTCSVTVAVTSAASCTITCNGVTYACAPVNTPVSAVCPSASSTAPDTTNTWSLWQWFKNLF